MIEVRFLGHSTVLLEFGGTRVLTDPFLRDRLGPLQRHGPVPDPGELEVDVVVISHGHPDHFDPRSIEALPGNPVIVVPAGLGAAARRCRGGRDVIEVQAGHSVDVHGLHVAGVPARHWIAPGAPRAKPIGYIIDDVAARGSGATSQIRATRGSRVYFAGDTGRYPAMADAIGRVDLALLPVWTWGPHLGPGHLGPRSAADVAAELAPQRAIPIHWGTLYPRHLHRLWPGPFADPGHRFAEHLRALAPQVAVDVLRPGERARIADGGRPA